MRCFRHFLELMISARFLFGLYEARMLHCVSTTAYDAGDWTFLSLPVKWILHAHLEYRQRWGFQLVALFFPSFPFSRASLMEITPLKSNGGFLQITINAVERAQVEHFLKYLPKIHLSNIVTCFQVHRSSVFAVKPWYIPISLPQGVQPALRTSSA